MKLSKITRTKLNRNLKALAAGTICTVLVLESAFPLSADAEYDESLTVTMADADIPEGTMAVGTHLISVSGMDDYIYEIATRSANESGQASIYYKSELTDGAWYDISSATDLEDISSSTSSVETSVIEDLHFTHETDSSGITYDLYSLQPVNIFDIYDAYDMDDFSELYSLKYKLKNLRSKQNKTDSDSYNVKLLADFFDTDISTSQTDTYDEELSALEVYYELLCEEDANADLKNTLHSVMESLDAKRRAVVYKNLYGSLLPSLLKKVQGYGNTSDIEDFVVDEELASTIQDAVTEVNSSYESYSNKMVTKGSTSISELEYTYNQQIIKYVVDGDREKADTYLGRLNSLYHIEGGKVVSGDDELDLIDDQLLQKVNSAYLTELGKGAGNVYDDAVENGLSAAAKEKALSERADSLASALNELEFVITAREDRLTNASAQTFIKKRISNITYFEKAIKDDAFQNAAEASIREYNNFLTNELTTLVEDSTEGSKMGKLNDEKRSLTEQRQQALDDNNLVAEKSLSLQIEDVEQRIDALSAELSEIIGDSESTKTEVAVAKANLGSGNTVSDVLSLKDNAISYIEDREYDAASEAVAGIITLMAQCKNTAITALKDVNAELLAAELTYPDDTGIKTIIEQIKDGLGDNSDLLLRELNKKTLDQFVQDEFGTDSKSLDSYTQAELLMALNTYYASTHDTTVEAYMSSVAEDAYNAGNKYIYPVLPDSASVFVEIECLSRCLGYRYVYGNSYKTAALKHSTSYYGFAAYQSTVTRENNGKDTMSQVAQFDGSIYIPADYVEEQFKLKASVLEGTDYCILTDNSMDDEVSTVLADLTTLAEGL